MKKQLAVALMTCALLGATAAPVEAGWWGKFVKGMGQVLQTNNHSSSSPSSSRNQMMTHNWQPLYKTQYYTVYMDMNNCEKVGEAQNRRVRTWLCREYTAEGSQWLGETSNGRVEPDVITRCVYYAYYGVYSSTRGISDSETPHYYDANNHLIYMGPLNDMNGDDKTGRYVPGDTNEHIRDLIFAKVGWNY